MKKILCLFGALTFALTSCSSDDDSSSDSSDLVLLKKTISTDSDGEKVTTTYKYNGDKIVSITDDQGEFNRYFTYTGDLITKIEYKLPNGTVDQINTYQYDSSNRLISFVRVEPLDEWGNKEVYTYNTDGTVSIKEYIGDDKTQTELNGEGKVTFTNGEATKIIIDYGPSRSYIYDDKNNPMKNVLGYDKLGFEDSEASGTLHNIVSEKDLDYDEITATYIFTYNPSGYPTKSVEDEEGEKATVEYFY
ncbi:hypothetical protein [Flavobacterium hydrophilum]|uniref:DUF4595 domain-containing protein n=1 Tax=Flavobacterium hydrophilum TaxID=2211445 RepID=A0A2V4BZZ0_9FLAO|nr:hypothetical protein [Flavobacterium hydrophilum]PXY43220.1 hypothetical protein DMB68_21275 [Flavobacterium hydrophilum]